MKRGLHLTSCFAIAALLTLWAMPSVGQTAPAPATIYSGEATVLEVTALGVDTEIVEAGPIGPGPGQDEENLFVASYPPGCSGSGCVVKATLLHASVLAFGSRSRSEASVHNLELNIPGNSIKAAFVMSQAIARCTTQGAVVSGRSFITSLTINGVPITVGTQPNFVIPLPGVGQIIINEQLVNTDPDIPGTLEIEVNAIHVEIRLLPGTADDVDIYVAQSEADIKCGAPGNGRDCVNGAGSIMGTPSGAKGQFAFAAGLVNSVPWWGHLMFTDTGSGLQVVGKGNTAYVVVNTTTRHFEGPAEINGQGGYTYKVDVVDKGESGGSDTFAITLSNGYSASGTLTEGNITLMHSSMSSR